MKYIIGLIFIISISFGTTSCQKEFSLSSVDSSKITPPPPPPGSVSGSFTATIDGVKFVADKGASASRVTDVIAIIGMSNSGEQIILRVADSGIHKYSLDINTMTNAGVYLKGTENAYSTVEGSTAAQSGGTLSITSIDTIKKTLSGTFSMKVYRQFDGKQKNITEGVFTNIQYETTAIPANGLDTFRVKVDGVQFPVVSITGLALYGRIDLSASTQSYAKTVGVSINENITTGTYTFSTFSDYIGQYNIGMSSMMTANSGTLTILEHNQSTKRIRGNFNFSAKEILGTNSASLTEGYFSVVYK
jgi:hypothetical protein